MKIANHAKSLGFPIPKDYTGPPDGLSHPHHRGVLRPVARGLLSLGFRIQVEGRENLPEDKPVIFAGNHPSTVEPALMDLVTLRDTRYMADYPNFTGFGGKVVTAMGAYPVDRLNPSLTAVKHSLDLLKDGVNLGLFPEGQMSEDPQQVGTFKPGVGTLAVRGKAEAVVPIAFHYKPDDQPRWGEKLAGWGAALAVGAGAVWASSAGPAAASLAGVVTGALTGAFTAGAAAHHFTRPTDARVPYNQLLATALAGTAGAVAGGVLGGLVPNPVFTVACPLSVLGMTHAWQKRPLAAVKIGQPIKVEPYTQQYGRKDAPLVLTEDVHRAVGHLKAELGGAAYDESAPKVRD